MRHTHNCPACKNPTACDSADCYHEPRGHVRLGEELVCMECLNKQKALAEAEVNAHHRCEIIRSLVPHVTAGLCGAAVTAEWSETDTARAIFVQAERIYEEGVRRGIYPGKVDG